LLQRLVLVSPRTGRRLERIRIVVLEPTGRLRGYAAPPIGALRDAGAKAVLVEPERSRAFDAIASKLTIPDVRRGSVSRTALVNRLRAAGAFPCVVVVAPAGYGKTTVLAQWAAKDARPFAWLSIDERDNDPVVLLRHLLAALDSVDPIEPRLLEALGSRQPSVWSSVMPRLAAHLAAGKSPFVLVLDDVDLLESKDSIAIVTTLIENLPARSMAALAGRRQPKLPVASFRVGGPLLEFGPYELALSRREGEMLLRACAVDLEEDAMVDLLERTEGWAAGIYLTALAVRDSSDSIDPADEVEIGGDDRYLADYLEDECMSDLSPELLAFLRHTSVLEKLSGPLCDAVLERTDSAAALAAIERLNLFLVPLDRHREWYRYHNLLRDLLRRKLADEEPQLVPVLNARAAEWFEEHDGQESALGYAHAAGDRDRAARILSSIALKAQTSGRAATLESWLRPFDDDDRLEQYPAVAIHGCRTHAFRGRPEEAERWLEAAERGAVSRRKGVASVRPCIAVMRSAMCSSGPAQMQTDAVAARSKLRRGASWRPSALLVEGAAAILLGNDAKADSILAEAAVEAERLGSNETRVIALGERSVLAGARGDYREAEELAAEACDLMEDTELKDYSTSALALAASARAMLRHGMWEKARHQLTLAENLLPRLTYALPWLAVQVRLEVGYACVTIRDRKGAERMLEEVRTILGVKPKLGVLSAGIDALSDEIEDMPEDGPTGHSALTAAELRLLPLLSTHLSFREIGERLFVSRNTIKTQAISVYRKLGVSSRSEAIARASELGLVGAEEQALAVRVLDATNSAASA
jgi:LuxR family transcriptional regulator, maltose regulon positive regulatory protein